LRDSVQAPLILTATLPWAARASSFGRSANGSAGGDRQTLLGFGVTLHNTVAY